MKMTKQKKTKKFVSRNKTREAEQVRLAELILQQAYELKIKDGQLRSGSFKNRGQIIIDFVIMANPRYTSANIAYPIIMIFFLGILSESAPKGVDRPAYDIL